MFWEGVFRRVRFALACRTGVFTRNIRKTAENCTHPASLFLHVDPFDPWLIHVGVVEPLADFTWRRSDDLDGLECDFADPVAGLQKTNKPPPRIEDAVIALAIKPLMFPAKRQRAFADRINHDYRLGRDAITSRFLPGPRRDARAIVFPDRRPSFRGTHAWHRCR